MEYRAFGYRYGEVVLDKIKPIKEGTFISIPRPVDLRRRPVVQASLGCPVVGAALPHPDPVDPDTMIAGVRKRFAFRPPEPDRALRARFRVFVRKWVRDNLVALPPDIDQSVEAWLAKCRYPAARKEELLRKWRECLSIKDLTKRYFMCKSFMKDEVYPSYKHARGINSRSDEFKAFCGPIFKLIEEVVYKHKSFIKHVPVADRPRYIRDLIYQVGGKYIATDYTAFESLFVSDLMADCEFELYDYMTSHLPNHDEFMDILSEALLGVNVCQYKNFVVKIPGTRMSGEMCTSLGNGFSNLMFMLFICSELGSECIGCVEGDDGIFSVKGAVPTAGDFEKLGLVIKLEEHSDLCAASFCGIIFDEVDMINVTNPLEVLCTMGWTTNTYHKANKHTKMKLLRCKALSYAHQYPGCPIIACLAKNILRLTRSYDVRYFAAEKWCTNQWEREQLLSVLGKKIPEKAVGIRTRLLVEEKYKISIESQILIEKYLDSLTCISPLSIPMMDLLTPPSWLHYWENYVIAGKDSSEEREIWTKRADHIREW